MFYRLLYLSCLFLSACATLLAQDSLKFSPEPGFYSEPCSVVISGGDAKIHFTLDGTTPTSRSPRYMPDQSIDLEKTTVIRAACFDAAGQRVGFLWGATYFIDEPASELLTLSVGVDPWRLFDGVHGWFVAGHGADPGSWKKPGANWWTRKEHPVHLDIFAKPRLTGDRITQRLHGSTVGFRMFGGMSRLHPQKSFSLSARKRYGDKRINYPLFGSENNKSFRFLVARNGGSDWGRSYIRDALLTNLLRDPSWDLEHQAARPVQVYLNGRYWGIYHLREKINPQFLEDHADGVDKDSLTLLEHQLTRKHGTTREYQQLLDFVKAADLSDPDQYARIGRLMDVDNFQRLQIAQTYFDNRDAGGNIRFWRPDGKNQRFRWILYDVDQGFGLHRDSAWAHNTLAFYTADDGPQWPNPPWSTLLQRKLLAHPDYRHLFVNRCLDYLHTDFSAEAVGELTETQIASVRADMPRHLKRWNKRLDHWEYHLDRIREFGRRRPGHLREHLRKYFSAGPDRRVDLSAGRGGYVMLNRNLSVGADGLNGHYFANFPLLLEARPEPGYRFVGWETTAEITAPFSDTLPQLTLDLTSERDYRLRATFTPARHPLADQVIINEVCPRNQSGGDWLELHNRSERSVNLADWFLIDNSGRRFVLPDIEIFAGNYLAICEKEADFRAFHPGVYGVVGDLPFGLHRRDDRIGLYAADGSYVNSIAYQLPAVTDSTFVYALALPGLDNGKHKNWVLQSGTGTPGAPNPQHLQTAVITRQNYWLRIGVAASVLLLLTVLGAKRARAVGNEGP